MNSNVYQDVTRKVIQLFTIWKREHEGGEITPLEEEDVDFVVTALHAP